MGLLALVWLLAWVPIGLWAGDIDYALTTVSRGTVARQIYQILLYSGLLLVFWDSWRKHKPSRPKWGKWSHFAFYFLQGLIASVVLRFLLNSFHGASWVVPELGFLQILGVLVSCLAVALVEEAVFRGFLLGTLVNKFGWMKGSLLTSLIFSSVHLFRPGSPGFKAMYGIGLFLLGYLLARLAYHHNSILASAGFHAGVILLNLGLVLESFQPSLLTGWSREPVSGLLSIGLTVLFWMGWELLANNDKLPFQEERASGKRV